MQILIGICDSNIGGLNKYITDYIFAHSQDTFVVVASGAINSSYKKMLPDTTEYILVPSVFHFIKLYKLTKMIINKYNIDSLYLNISTNLFYPVVKAAFDCGVKTRVVHSHSSYSANENFFKRNLIVMLNILLQKKVNRLATKRKACSSKAAKWLFGENAEYEFIHNKIDAKKFEFSGEIRAKLRKELSLEKVLIIGFVGGFNYQKNTEYFFDIAKKLARYRKDFAILMLGDGPKKSSFEKKLKKMRLKNHFILLGNRPDANEYYNAFDCFVLPSRFEGLPYVGIEAQVNNLKCFFSDRITTQAKITEECEFFSLNKKDCLIKALAKLEIRDSSLLHKLLNFKNFIF
ncbi:MAG: glycosyltransferase family 1 protein [Treponema sp.]|nr:glycosyltransferase family 1 protein [Treponema sp.]